MEIFFLNKSGFKVLFIWTDTILAYVHFTKPTCVEWKEVELQLAWQGTPLLAAKMNNNPDELIVNYYRIVLPQK